MISTHEKIRLTPELSCEVNWNKAVIPCKKFRLTDEKKGTQHIIDRDSIYSMLFMFGDDEQQSSLVPVVSMQVREVVKLLKVRAKKDIKKGDEIVIRHTEYHTEAVRERFEFGDSITQNEAAGLINAIGAGSTQKKALKN